MKGLFASLNLGAFLHACVQAMCAQAIYAMCVQAICVQAMCAFLPYRSRHDHETIFPLPLLASKVSSGCFKVSRGEWP